MPVSQLQRRRWKLLGSIAIFLFHSREKSESIGCECKHFTVAGFHICSAQEIPIEPEPTDYDLAVAGAAAPAAPALVSSAPGSLDRGNRGAWLLVRLSCLQLPLKTWCFSNFFLVLPKSFLLAGLSEASRDRRDYSEHPPSDAHRRRRRSRQRDRRGRDHSEGRGGRRKRSHK